MRSSRRHALSFGTSLGAHAALLLLVLFLSSRLVPKTATSAKHKNIAVEMIDMHRTRAPAVDTRPPTVPMVVAASGENRIKVSRHRAPQAPSAQGATPVKEVPLKGQPEPGFQAKFSRDSAASSPIDLKAGLVIRPRDGDSQPGTNPWGGSTIHNGPGAEPDHDAVVAENARLAQNRIGTFVEEARDIQAHRRAEDGVVDDYFRTLRHSLESATKNPPPFGAGNFLGDVGNALVNNPAYKNYAKTGNPYPDRVDPLYETSPLGGVGMGNSNLPPPQTFNFGFVKGSDGGLEARVEMWQSIEGKLVKLSLIKSSGNKDFDAHVVRNAPNALKDLPPPPPDGAGVHPEGIHSLWAFQGKISYMKSAKNVNMKKDWAGVAAAAIPSLLSGMPFDETTGDVYVLDPSSPEFVVKVHLLAVY
jgi:hypothetical protein